MPNYNITLQTNNSSLEEIITQLNNMPNAGDSNPVLQDKTVTPTTNAQTVTADSGYDGLNTVTVNAMPTAIQATPNVSINQSTGLITATATQNAGYISAGTKSGTLQLAFQAAQTITPGTTNKIIAANTYLGGVQTIKGDANLVASNIVSGKSIFGVVGTATTGGGGSSGDMSIEDAMVAGTLTSYTNDRVKNIRRYAFGYCSSLTTVSFPACTSIGSYAFYYCSSLTAISFPACTSIGNYAFGYCPSLTTVSFPACTGIGSSAFYYCSSLTTVSFPACTSIGSYAFYYCSSLITVKFPRCTGIGSNAFYSCRNLKSANFPACTSIGSYAFYSCYQLSEFYLLASSVCKLSASNAFQSTPFAGYSNYFSGTPYIYVPASLVDAYKSATNWTYFSKYISSI